MPPFQNLVGGAVFIIARLVLIAILVDVEILSPDQSQTKVTKNILNCLKYETQMGWLIDPEEQAVFIYLPDRPTDVFDQLDARLPVPEFALDFHLTVGELFDWLLE